MTYEWPHIAIPSYRRADTLQTKTLTVLSELKVPRENITIFVASPEELNLYRKKLDKSHYGELVVAEPGMGAVRRYIQQYYPQGVEIVNVDDDISGFYVKRHDKKYEPVTPEEFQTMVRLGFWTCRKAQCRLWGIYPVLNPLFMKKRVKVGLTYIVGAFWGCINSWEEALTVTLDDKEDFERTLKHYLADGAVIRLEAYSLKTAYYSTPGGMQIDRTPERVDASARELVRRYPLLCKLNTAKKSGKTEVRLVDPKKRRVLA